MEVVSGNYATSEDAGSGATGSGNDDRKDVGLDAEAGSGDPSASSNGAYKADFCINVYMYGR